MNDAVSSRLGKSWGERLRAARRAKGFTQTTFAARVGHMTQTTISRYERGEGSWTPEVLVTFAVALETTVPELFPWPVGIEDAERFRQSTSNPAVA